jgi:hypothetical protein
MDASGGGSAGGRIAAKGPLGESIDIFAEPVQGTREVRYHTRDGLPARPLGGGRFEVTVFDGRGGLKLVVATAEARSAGPQDGPEWPEMPAPEDRPRRRPRRRPPSR